MEVEVKPCHDSSPPPTTNIKIDNPDESSFTWLQDLSLDFLTFISIVTIYRSVKDPWAITFVVASYLDPTLLLLCARLLERTPKDSPKRASLKLAVWLLSTVLILTYSYLVAIVMPSALAGVTMGLSVLSVTTNFYVLFVCRRDDFSINGNDSMV